VNPPFIKRIGRYLQCVVAVAFIAMMAASHFEGEGEHEDLVSINYNRGAIVFLTLLIPVFFGAHVGYATHEQFPPE
jgi:hypothetical protein